MSHGQQTIRLTGSLCSSHLCRCMVASYATSHFIILSLFQSTCWIEQMLQPLISTLSRLPAVLSACYRACVHSGLLFVQSCDDSCSCYFSKQAVQIHYPCSTLIPLVPDSRPCAQTKLILRLCSSHPTMINSRSPNDTRKTYTVGVICVVTR